MKPFGMVPPKAKMKAPFPPAKGAAPGKKAMPFGKKAAPFPPKKGAMPAAGKKPNPFAK
jgi:hypothetical protein